jgi:hypothetical protein
MTKTPKNPDAIVKVVIIAEFPLDLESSINGISDLTSMLEDTMSNFQSIGSVKCTVSVPAFTSEIK